MLGASTRKGFLKEFLTISVLFSVQIIFAVQGVFMKWVLILGLDPLFAVVSWSLGTAISLLPLAIIFEKKKWPTKLSITLVVQFMLLALGGVTMLQALLLFGTKMTSPAIASAMMNLVPGLIFIIAAGLRFEKFDIWCKYTRAKILGTLVCLSGAMVISFLESPSSSDQLTSNKLSLLSDLMNKTISKDWMLGCFYLLAAVVSISCYSVLQAVTMRNFPAPLSLCVVIFTLGSILTAILQIILEGKIAVGSTSFNVMSIIGIVIGGTVLMAACQAIQAWGINRKGPVLVAIFMPVQTICSAILSAMLLGQIMSLGSLSGMILMFSGLYMFLWAKKNEGLVSVNAEDNSTKQVDDIEKPLLS